MNRCDEVPLAEMLTGELNVQESQSLLDHLEVCPTCQERLRVMTILDQMGTEEVKRKGRKFWAMAAAVFLVCILPVLYFLGGYREESIWPTLSTKEAYPYFPLETRSEPSTAPSEAAREALLLYAHQDFGNAAEALSDLPSSGREVQFYLGVSLYLSGDYERSIDVLEVLTMELGRWERPARWYLAQAYLQASKPGNALKELEVLSQSPGEFSEAADLLAAQIRKAQAEEAETH